MKVRGERECRDCGARWSYYETGSVTCPDCGSLRSVGVNERKVHTADTATLDLTAARNALERDRPLREVLTEAKERCREYVRRRGFVHAGELRPLDDAYLAAAELSHAADLAGRSFAPTDAEELYVLALLGGADAGERPDSEDVPDSMREARGLAAVEAVRAYRSDVRTTLDGGPDAPVRELLASLDEHVRRMDALEGDVNPRDAERLVRATRDLHACLVDGEEERLADALDRLDRLA